MDRQIHSGRHTQVRFEKSMPRSAGENCWCYWAGLSPTAMSTQEAGGGGGGRCKGRPEGKIKEERRLCKDVGMGGRVGVTE